MKLTQTDIEELKTILAACKVVGVEGVVIFEGMARGARPSLDAAILTKTKLSIDPSLKLGIGRVAELEKRLSIFGTAIEIEGKENDKSDITLLSMASGKTKMQYRCQAVNLIKYPKENVDEPFAIISLTRAEVAQVSKAAKTLGSERLVLQVTRAGIAKLECVDSSNDRFDIELEKPVEFVEEEDSAVQSYIASLLVDVLDSASKDGEDITFTLGQAGSITAITKGHTVLVMAQISGEDD